MVVTILLHFQLKNLVFRDVTSRGPARLTSLRGVRLDSSVKPLWEPQVSSLEIFFKYYLLAIRL